MHVFRSFVVLAATAFATFTAAAPTGPSSALSNGSSDAKNIDNNAGQGSTANLTGVGLRDVINVSDRRRVESDDNNGNTFLSGRACTSCRSLPGVFVNADVRAKVLIQKCKDTTKSGPIKADVAVKLLNDVKDQLKALIADVSTLSSSKGQPNLLNLNGKSLTVEACAKTIVDLVLSICAAIQVIVSATVKADLAAVLNVVAEIGVLIADLLKLCFNLVAHIDVSIAALIKAKLQLFVDLKLQAVVSLVAGVKA